MKSINLPLIVNCLNELGDRNLQERLWTYASPGEFSSFVEAHEQLFSDSGLGDALDSTEGAFSAEIDERLRKLGVQLRRFDTERAPQEIIDDPEMEPIRAMAREAAGMIERLPRM